MKFKTDSFSTPKYNIDYNKKSCELMFQDFKAYIHKGIRLTL